MGLMMKTMDKRKPFPELEELLDHLSSPEILRDKRIMEEKIAFQFYERIATAIHTIEFWESIND